MKIDTEHLHYWMQAIRQSPDPIRTLDAFWSGQIKSKEWLIEQLKPFVHKPSFIEIHGGWVGVLASMLFQSGISVSKIRSIDIDSTCAPTATMMNKQEEMAGKFEAVIGDICTSISFGDIIINTSCEHMSQKQYEIWLQRLPEESLIVLQSNNYNLPEHVRPAMSLNEFKKQSKISTMWSGSLTTQIYERWMIIGYKNV